MLELLYRFKTNIVPALQTEISAAGTDPGLITDIIGYADEFSASNIRQETLKGGRKEITQENVGELNAIYNEVIGIARISARIFKDSYPIRDQFSYAKILKALGHQGAASANGNSSTPAVGTASELQPV